MMNQQNARLVAGSRKNSKVLVRDGFKYQKNKVTNTIYWRCWRDTCRANLITDDFDFNDPNALINVRRAEDHDHEEDEDLIEIDRHKEKLRCNIIANPTTPTKHVYREMVANEVAAGTADHLPDFNSVRSSMCRQRSCLIPPIPHLVSDVDIPDSWAETWNNANFVIEQRVNNNPVYAVIYGTDNDK